MPESLMGKTNPESSTPREAAKAAASSRFPRRRFSTEPKENGNLAVATDEPSQFSRWTESDRPWLRINWEIKALAPIACVLLGGMLLFLLATLSWRDPERHLVLLVAGAGAVAICGALLTSPSSVLPW